MGSKKCPHNALYSDYHLQKRSDKVLLYRGRKLWWSDEIGRWMCTDADVIRSILLDHGFEVMSYSQDMIAKRLGINLEHVTRMIGFFPIALHGDAHKQMRKRHAICISQESKTALQTFRSKFAEQLQYCLASPQPVDITKNLVRPAVLEFIAALSGIESRHLERGDSLSQILDETLSPRTRLNLEQNIAQIAAGLPEHMDDEEKYFRIAMVALGTDSMLGTLTESLHTVLSRNQGIPLSAVPFPDEVPATGVPVIERIAMERREFDGITIEPGQRIRLYLDAAGYVSESTMPTYQSLYFGAGRHACLGTAITKQVWKVVTEELMKIDHRVEIVRAVYRDNDNVFNLYKEIEVNIHE